MINLCNKKYLCKIMFILHWWYWTFELQRSSQCSSVYKGVRYLFIISRDFAGGCIVCACYYCQKKNSCIKLANCRQNAHRNGSTEKKRFIVGPNEKLVSLDLCLILCIGHLCLTTGVGHNKGYVWLVARVGFYWRCQLNIILCVSIQYYCSKHTIQYH